jgi:hypothetical protein
LTQVGVGAALVALRGNVSAVARRYKVARSAVQQMIAARPELQSIRDDARQTRIDEAEDALDRAVRRGEGWAVCFTLKTLGRERGYIERHEMGLSKPPVTDESTAVVMSPTVLAAALALDEAIALEREHAENVTRPKTLGAGIVGTPFVPVGAPQGDSSEEGKQ